MTALRIAVCPHCDEELAVEQPALDVERVAAAEAVCLMYGWSAVSEATPRQRATHALWKRWVRLVDPDFLTPERHPDLSDEAIARLTSPAAEGEQPDR
jgi:hypothetical protein